MFVYIAGPMTKGHRVANLRKAIDVAERIASRGHTVFIPNLWDTWYLIYPHNNEFWMNQDLQMVRRCDIVVRIFGPSEGADRETNLAKTLGKVVFGDLYTTGLEEFMNSKYWANTEVPSNYSTKGE